MIPRSSSELAEMLYATEEKITEIEELLKVKRQVIFYGPPGTSKTYFARKFADYFTQNTNHVKVVQFHPSYSYEDFIEGIRPNLDEEGKASGFSKQWGLLRKLVDTCNKNRNDRFILLIDEINRGNIPKIFGELIYLLEYRDEKVFLTYSPDAEFSIPDNLYIIGTMNSADRSIAYIDYALRRRFYFAGFYPDYDILEKWFTAYPAKVNSKRIIDVLKNVNEDIIDSFGKEYQIGHSYFMIRDLDEAQLKRILDYSIKPLLEQYFYGKKEDVQALISDCNQMLSK
jgi:5-methylcytosine-specific restriction protein B